MKSNSSEILPFINIASSFVILL